MDREFKSKKRYLYAFIIGTIIFCVIFLISYSVSYLELNRVYKLQNNVAYEIFEDKFYYSFFKNDMCGSSSLDDLSQSLNFQRGIIDNLEKKLGKDNPAVLSRKRFYTLIELEHFDFVITQNKQCNTNITTILFFYSNDEEIIEESLYLGMMIENVAEQNKNLMIYSFDFNLDNDLIDNLKNKYNVTSPLTIIINENVKLSNPENIDLIIDNLS